MENDNLARIWVSGMKESQKGLEGPGVQVQAFQEGNQECFRSRPRPPTPGGQTFGVKEQEVAKGTPQIPSLSTPIKEC